MSQAYIVTESGAYLVTESSVYITTEPLPPRPTPVLLKWKADVTPELLWNQSVPTEQNWSMYLGQDVTATCLPETPGGPITGWTLQLTVANPAGTAIITKTPTIADGPNGIFAFSLAHADTASLAVGQYGYDVSRTDSGSDTVLLTGTITLSRRGGGGT